VDVYKQPVTDPAKVSKKGRMTLELDEDTGQYVTRQQGTGDLAKDLMMTVFEDGKLIREYTFDEVRERAELPLVKQRKQEQRQ